MFGPVLTFCQTCRQEMLYEMKDGHLCPGPPITLADIKVLLEKILQKLEEK